MEIFEAQDNSTTEFQSFDLDWLPASAYEYVTPRVMQSESTRKVCLRVGPYVGAVPLAGDRVLYLTPRIGRKMFSRMIFVSEGLEKSVSEEFDDLAQIGYDEGEGSWTQLLARPFSNKLKQIEKESLMPDRTREREQLPYVRGRLDVVPTLKSTAKRETAPAHCQYSRKTFNTAENRMLSAAAVQLLGLGAVEARDFPVVVRWADRFGGDLTQSEFHRIVNGLISGRYTGPRSYYIPALVMARLILAQGSVHFTHADVVETEALLTNMDLLFERYCRRVISNEFSPDGFSVEKVGGSSRAPQLFLDGTCTMEPDILVSDSTGHRLVADVKYKPDSHKVESSDYYQITAYIDAFRCSKGVLILPGRNGKEFERRRTKEGKTVYEMRIPLGDYNETEDILSKGISRVLNS